MTYKQAANGVWTNGGIIWRQIDAPDEMLIPGPDGLMRGEISGLLYDAVASWNARKVTWFIEDRQQG